jgi:hypothetical protein
MLRLKVLVVAQALLRKYGPIVVIVVAFIFLFWLRKVLWG